jgi:hypothetical protein
MSLDFEYIEGKLPREQSVVKEAVDCCGSRRTGDGNLETVSVAFFLLGDFFFDKALAAGLLDPETAAFFSLFARFFFGTTSAGGLPDPVLTRSAMQTSSDVEDLLE